MASRRTSLPVWASKTCEDCFYRINAHCRHHINNYGYTPVADGKGGGYRPACSYWLSDEGLRTEDGDESK